jgi:hypothetical protein
MLVVVFLFTASMFSQDLIITKDSIKINAKVIEVNIDNITYKNLDNKDETLHSMLKTELSSIIYQNGQVDVFESESQNSSVVLKNLGKQIPDNKWDIVVDMEMYDSRLYKQYRVFNGMRKAGIIILSAGLCSSFIGIFSVYNYMPVLGIATLLSGAALFTTGLPLNIVGGVGHRRIISEFSRQYYSTQPTKTYLQINLQGNKIGLAYVF